MVVDFQGFHKLPGNFAEFMKKHKRSQVSKCFSMENAGGGGAMDTVLVGFMLSF